MRPDDCPHPKLACIECYGYEYCYLTPDPDYPEEQEIISIESQQRRDD